MRPPDFRGEMGLFGGCTKECHLNNFLLGLFQNFLQSWIPLFKIPRITYFSNCKKIRGGWSGSQRKVIKNGKVIDPPLVLNPFPTTGGLINFRDFGFHTAIVSKLDGFWCFSRFLLMVKSVVAIIFKTTKQSPRKIIFSIFPGSDKVHTVKTP